MNETYNKVRDRICELVPELKELKFGVHEAPKERGIYGKLGGVILSHYGVGEVSTIRVLDRGMGIAMKRLSQ